MRNLCPCCQLPSSLKLGFPQYLRTKFCSKGFRGILSEDSLENTTSLCIVCNLSMNLLCFCALQVLYLMFVLFRDISCHESCCQIVLLVFSSAAFFCVSSSNVYCVLQQCVCVVSLSLSLYLQHCLYLCFECPTSEQTPIVSHKELVDMTSIGFIRAN